MTNYHTRLTLTSVDLSIAFGKQQIHRPQLFNWSYRFSDGSRIVGQVKAELDKDGKTLLKPSKLGAEYIGTDGQTVLLSWKDEDFALFEADADGSNLLLVASNDRFVENSMCLVSSKPYPRAQVTHWGIQLFKEEFNHSAWSIVPVAETETVSQEKIIIDWVFSPLFPFIRVSLNFWLPLPQITYQWTFHPYLPMFPLFRRLATTVDAECVPVELCSL